MLMRWFAVHRNADPSILFILFVLFIIFIIFILFALFTVIVVAVSSSFATMTLHIQSL